MIDRHEEALGVTAGNEQCVRWALFRDLRRVVSLQFLSITEERSSVVCNDFPRATGYQRLIPNSTSTACMGQCQLRFSIQCALQLPRVISLIQLLAMRFTMLHRSNIVLPTCHQRTDMPRTYTVIVVPSNFSKAVYIALPPLPFCAWKSMCFPS